MRTCSVAEALLVPRCVEFSEEAFLGGDPSYETKEGLYHVFIVFIFCYQGE